MSFFRRYAIPLNVLVIAVTMVFVGAALLVGRAVAAPTVEIAPGLTSPEDYIAPRPIDIVDEAATETKREAEALAVQTEYSVNPDIMPRVRNELSAFFEDLRRLATLTAEEANIEVEPTEIELVVLGAGGLDIIITESEGVVRLTGTVPDAETRERVVSALESIAGVIEVDDSLVVIDPPPVTTTTEAPAEGDETTTTVTTTTVVPPTTTTTLPRRTVEDWTVKLTELYPDLSDTTILSFVTLYNNDLDRIANGEASLFQAVQDAADALAKDLLTKGIKVSELGDVKAPLLSETPPVFVSVLPVEERLLAHPAIGELVANELLPNLFEDEEATTVAREEAAAAVQDIKVTFPAFSLIASEGEVLTRVQVDAITELGLIEKEPGTSRQAIVVLGALTVALAAFFLWRLAPGQWSQPKHFALLGILLVLAALASRFPELVNTEDGEVNQVAFAIPAMLFGYVAAILYDPRTAVLMSVPVTTFVAISTADPAITVFAAGATVAPVAFVSSVSSRRQLRVAVALSALVLVPLGASVSWLFRGYETLREAALFALLGGILAGLIAQGLVSFLENLFRMTTTLTLLDLVDRNHPALRLIEEKSPGTFNHSILVGTLAGKAARAVGADPLLAQAAAFYHDLGKTEDPVYFIENQFSITNPHDQLDPVESCKIIRSHVTDGLRLARQYRLPPDVSAGIRSHHGTGLMRYFYHQALEADPDVDPQLFRHHGEKPKRKEMAILMICDAVEGAARAHAQEQDPTEESIAKVVDAVVGEKLDDGQLAESDLTFGDLTNVKVAIVDALVGYYHTRVPYPGFPGPQTERA
ncbi:MAG: HDIG domain-containing protein [Actinomycetota bacterium]|nr:HDIG domain-containing protein [Actinomycetota bacterium]